MYCMTIRYYVDKLDHYLTCTNCIFDLLLHSNIIILTDFVTDPHTRYHTTSKIVLFLVLLLILVNITFITVSILVKVRYTSNLKKRREVLRIDKREFEFKRISLVMRKSIVTDRN